ncbi:MAG: hypothetical protein L3J52_04285 [Proteobacteria bacterium]|nr:hypothetical protein [Pseudomonadota bacterium]
MKALLTFELIVLVLVMLNQFWESQAELDRLEKLNKSKPVSTTTRTQCGTQLQSDKFITTTFKEYSFIYPCSAEPKSINRHYYERLKRFEIKLLLSIAKDKDTIWPQTPKDIDSVAHNAKLRIFAFGEGIETPQVNVNKDNLEFVRTLENAPLDIYHNYRRVTGFLSTQKDAIGSAPVIKCTLDKFEHLGDIFNENFHQLNYNTNCRAYWMLSQDIAVKLYGFDASFAYDFASIYHKVKQALSQVIQVQTHRDRGREK